MVKFVSAKVITLMMFFMVVIFKLSYADEYGDEDIDDDLADDVYPPDNDDQGPSCPEELSGFYKECKGKLGTCVDCIQKAEKNCEHAQIDLQADGSCYECTSLFANRCDPAEHMCFGYQECGGGNMHCINFKCVNDS